MEVQLVVIGGPDKGRTFPLHPGEPLQIGRSQTTGTRLTDPSVSRVHCEVVVDGATATLHDRSSTGTFVNGQKVSQHVLRPGDIVHIGDTDLRYAVAGQEPATVAPAAVAKALAKDQL